MDTQQRFESLYSAHAGAVLAYALRRTDRASAEDALADVFLVAWRRLQDVPADERVWLLGVARRVLANQRRGSTRQLALRERLTSQAQAWTPGVEVRDDRLLEALARLRTADREALLLVAWDGLSHDEAARVLGIRARTFGVRIHRARRRLERALTLGEGGTAGCDERPTTMEVT